ncbi:MAG: 50S ribosomal protein L1 [Thaumarchaeota archaeon]|nr:50S ribosomal protein L1 [Nitrososphaerota archaeon]
MINESKIIKMIDDAKNSNKCKFKQAVEIIIVFKDVDAKKGFTIKDIIQLPNKKDNPSSICVFASGEMGLKANNAKADNVIDANQLSELSSDKKKIKKFINKYDFFLADTKLMPIIGKNLGQFLGPRGKMPTPIPFNASIESILSKFQSSIRIKTSGSSALSCKIGNENMPNEELASNAFTIINAVEKKLPNGDKNIKKILVKTTMGEVIQ